MITRYQQNPLEKNNLKLRSLRLFGIFVLFVLLLSSLLFAAEAREPIEVNGDQVEYSPDNQEVIASGNVVVIFKDSRLTCDRIKVNTQTKVAEAEGHVRIEEKRGILEAEKAVYNFENKTGKIFNAKITFLPYYGRGEVIERVSENQFNVGNGYITTCDLDQPHYRMRARDVQVYPENKVRVKNTAVLVGEMPLFYLPQYTHSLKDPFMHVRLLPGKSKDWGPYMLSAWRYNLTENIRGRIYLDYRQKLGIAEGFGLNYAPPRFGKGDFKYYYTQERPRDLPEGSPAEFQRYLIRWRHMWDIDSRTKATLEYYKISDSKMTVLGSENDFLKDYFYREYEKDSQPKTYLSVTHSFANSSLNFLLQKRTNRWYVHSYKQPDEKLPEINYDLPSYQLWRLPFYFKNKTQFSSLTNKNAAPSDIDDDVVRFDSYNQLSLPTKLVFFWFTPFVGVRETFYSKDKYGSSLDPRTTFYSGADLSTKFYRTFDFSTNFLKLGIQGIRHVISPALQYSYNHSPSVAKERLQIFDDTDTLERSNQVILELTNKLQTKRNNQTVDLAILKVSSEYNFSRREDRGKGFADFLLDLELIPYAWLRIESDATYDSQQKYFKIVNFDLIANFGKDRSFGIGNRYERKGGKELTSQFNWRFNPKWKFRIYQRYQFAKVRERGLAEQEYAIARDLHCWTTEFAYNISKEHGHTIWMILKLKAFPEMGIDFDQSYRQPKAGLGE